VSDFKGLGYGTPLIVPVSPIYPALMGTIISKKGVKNYE